MNSNIPKAIISKITALLSKFSLIANNTIILSIYSYRIKIAFQCIASIFKKKKRGLNTKKNIINIFQINIHISIKIKGNTSTTTIVF